MCQAVTTATTPTVDTRTDCKKCQDCLAVVKDLVVTPALGYNNSLYLASTFVQNCVGNLTANDVLLCKNVAASIAFSYNGNLAKRAGALCSRLGQCVGDAVTAKCNVTTGLGLDLCTQEGYVSGTAIAVANAGEWMPSALGSRCAGLTGCSLSTPIIRKEPCQLQPPLGLMVCGNNRPTETVLLLQISAILHVRQTPIAQAAMQARYVTRP